MTDTSELHWRFLKQWSIGLFVLLVCTAGFNYLIDPYGLFDTPRIAGINAVKPAAANHVRMAKPYQGYDFAPQTVIAGNSRPEMGLDPLNACWPDDARPVFNMGIPGSSLYMQARSIQHLIATGNVRHILWGLDFLDFLGTHENSKSPWNSSRPRSEFEERLKINADGSDNPGYKWMRIEDQFKSLLSLDTVKDSLKTIFSQTNPNISTIRRDGFNPARDYLDIIAWEGQNVLFQQKNDELRKMFSRPDFKLYADGSNWSQQFESVDRLLDIAAQHDIRVTLFINPYHADYLSTLEMTGHWANFEIWKRNLLSLATKYGFTLWDFSYINTRIVEKVPAPGDKKTMLKWFWEPAHYKREYGNLMLSRMLDLPCDSNESQSTGTLLTEANIDGHLIDTRDDMQRYFSTRN